MIIINFYGVFLLLKINFYMGLKMIEDNLGIIIHLILSSKHRPTPSVPFPWFK